MAGSARLTSGAARQGRARGRVRPRWISRSRPTCARAALASSVAADSQSSPTCFAGVTTRAVMSVKRGTLDAGAVAANAKGDDGTLAMHWLASRVSSSRCVPTTTERCQFAIVARHAFHRRSPPPLRGRTRRADAGSLGSTFAVRLSPSPGPLACDVAATAAGRADRAANASRGTDTSGRARSTSLLRATTVGPAC